MPVPRLNSQLFESEISIQIGDRNFQIPRDIFSGPGDSPNFFTLGFGAFFASPTQTFPGLERIGLLRPPAIVPPSIPNRSGDVFADILHLLRGYPLYIRNETHRAELLRDCRYFHLRGLEQTLIPHDIGFNPIRQRTEISIRLEDVRRSGVNFAPDPTSSSPPTGWVSYSRPFIDDQAYDLIVEIGDECTIVDLSRMRAQFLHLTKTRIASLLQIIASKAISAQPSSSTPTPPASGISNSPAVESCAIRVERDADLIVDGQVMSQADLFGSPDGPDQLANSQNPPAKRRRIDGSSGGLGKWIVRTGQWRLRVQPSSTSPEMEVVMVAVKLDVYSDARMRNRGRRFLGS